ncbi:uncharacterized protein [Phaseolus vulgaris]|uniref:uncharacterized protein n=1 Tax=Phaseolus vulgaris TaxID=3885 RepID=UPI0035CBA06F
MLIVNLNIRGLGGGTKARYLRSIIGREEAEFVCLQETKTSELSDARCYNLWGDNKVGWVHNKGDNGSGSLLSLWNTKSFTYESHVMGKGFIIIIAQHIKSSSRCVVANIYSPCSLSGKKTLWDDLSNTKSVSRDRIWCMCGDFNAVRIRSERKGVKERGGQVSERNDFNSFIDSNLLMELPIVGKKFTWFKHDGSAKSRIDRVLVSEEWLRLWPMSKQYVLRRKVSDHCAIVVKSVEKD